MEITAIPLGNEEAKSKAIRSSSNPEWNEMYFFTWDQLSKLVIAVVDMCDETHVGDLIVNLTDFEAARKTTYNVDMPLANVECCGSIHLDIKFQAANNLTVRLRSASNLMAVDFGGSSDPYVILTVGEEEQKSRCIEKSLNPTWDEEFHFSWDNFSNIRIQVMDENRFREHVPLGDIEVNLVQESLNLLRKGGLSCDVSLDFALQNTKSGSVSLHLTIRSDYMEMLNRSLDSLEVCVREDRFVDIPRCAQGVTQLLRYFTPLLSANWLDEIRPRLEPIEEILLFHINKIFEIIAEPRNSINTPEELQQFLPGDLQTLGDVFAVVDSLGMEVREKVVGTYVQNLLKPYNADFKPGKPRCRYATIRERWIWFKSVDESRAALCPLSWHVSLYFCCEFLRITKDHIASLLTQSAAMDVAELIDPLRLILQFERDMKAKYERMLTDQRSQQSRRSIGFSIDADDEDDEDAEETIDLLRAVSFIDGAISCAFEGYLGGYVLPLKQRMTEFLERIVDEEELLVDNRFNTSMTLFNLIRQSVDGCAALTRGQALYTLFCEVKKVLMQYASCLRKRCPHIVAVVADAPEAAAVSQESSSSLLRRRNSILPFSGNGIRRLIEKLEHDAKASVNGSSAEDVRAAEATKQTMLVCLVVNTADYCAEVLPGLETAIQKLISEQFIEHISLTDEVDNFIDVVALGMNSLIFELMDQLNPVFQLMMDIRWTDLEELTDGQSLYVVRLSEVLAVASGKVFTSLAPSYFNSFCVKISRALLQRFLEVVKLQRKLGEVACSQLLVDLSHVLPILLNLRSLDTRKKLSCGDESSVSSNIDDKVIMEETFKIESFISLVREPIDGIVGCFRSLWPTCSFEDVVAVLEVKAASKEQQDAIILSLGLVAPLDDAKSTYKKAPSPRRASLITNILGADDRGSVANVKSSQVTPGDLARDFIVEIFENERCVPFKGFSYKHLLLYPRFSDATGKRDLDIGSSSSQSSHKNAFLALEAHPPPPGCEWLGSWKVDNSLTQTDRSGWSYAMSYDFLVSNCEKAASLTNPSVLHNSRRRKWVRRARRLVDNTIPPLPPPSSSPRVPKLDARASSFKGGESGVNGRVDSAQQLPMVETNAFATKSTSSVIAPDSKPATVVTTAAATVTKGVITVVEAFENERRVPFKGFSPGNLFLHPRFSDVTGKKNLKYVSLNEAPPPPGYAWVDDWTLDKTHTQTDENGWSYAVSYEFLVSNCQRNSSITSPNLAQNSRRRRWTRRAGAINGDG